MLYLKFHHEVKQKAKVTYIHMQIMTEPTS